MNKRSKNMITTVGELCLNLYELSITAVLVLKPGNALEACKMHVDL
jgi:hypothetical protein